MNGDAAEPNGDVDKIARALVAARAAGRALPGFPGPVPETLAEAYAVQEAVIALTGDDIVGWKVAMIPPELRARFGAERVCGPVFRRTLLAIGGDAEPDFPIIPEGFAAVEAEFVIELAADLPETGIESIEQLEPYVRAYRAGAEIAGSPVARLNPLGSAAVVCDCGGNAGLIVGPELGGTHVDILAMSSETRIDGASVGTGDGARIPGGPLSALLFLARQLAARGRRLRAGDLVSTGASTGIHPVVDGSRCAFLFDGRIAIRARANASIGS